MTQEHANRIQAWFDLAFKTQRLDFVNLTLRDSDGPVVVTVRRSDRGYKALATYGGHVHWGEHSKPGDALALLIDQLKWRRSRLKWEENERRAAERRAALPSQEGYRP